jgi:hypothetical protein
MGREPPGASGSLVGAGPPACSAGVLPLSYAPNTKDGAPGERGAAEVCRGPLGERGPRGR